MFRIKILRNIARPDFPKKIPFPPILSAFLVKNDQKAKNLQQSETWKFFENFLQKNFFFLLKWNQNWLALVKTHLFPITAGVKCPKKTRFFQKNFWSPAEGRMDL
jgi:hypothetical protein